MDTAYKTTLELDKVLNPRCTALRLPGNERNDAGAGAGPHD